MVGFLARAWRTLQSLSVERAWMMSGDVASAGFLARLERTNQYLSAARVWATSGDDAMAGFSVRAVRTYRYLSRDSSPIHSGFMPNCGCRARCSSLPDAFKFVSSIIANGSIAGSAMVLLSHRVVWVSTMARCSTLSNQNWASTPCSRNLGSKWPRTRERI